MTLVPELLGRLKDRELDHVKVIVGGIIPEPDIPKLEALGVAKVFTPGASLAGIADFVRSAVAA
jgi:methylmalonyl-CoA mutase C-terminal domain/subunit